MRVAILDDYQNVALNYADWGKLPADEITVFSEHIADTDALVTALAPYDVLVAMRERTAFPADRLARLPKLRLLVTTGMRNASVDFAAATEAGITICGTEGVDSATVEHTWALILSLARHVPAEDARIRAGGWQHTVGMGLEGRTLGILGVGRLGRLVGRIAGAFGMEVLAWSHHLDPERAREAGATGVGKEKLFRRSDVVTVHYKLGERSVGLVGATEIGWMKPTAYLVNTSRAPIVDNDALLAALREGRIAGAALDVYDVEPLPADHPIRSAPRTVLTPHLGYVTDSEYKVYFEQAVEDIVAFRAGSPVRVLNT